MIRSEDLSVTDARRTADRLVRRMLDRCSGSDFACDEAAMVSDAAEFILADRAWQAQHPITLDWVKHPKAEMHRAVTPFGVFTAGHIIPTQPFWQFDPYAPGPRVSSPCVDIASAKSAAQSHFGAIVLSMVRRPQPIDDEMMARLRTLDGHSNVLGPIESRNEALARTIAEALAPFAAVANDRNLQSHPDSYAPRPTRRGPNMGDFRKALATLNSLSGGKWGASNG